MIFQFLVPISVVVCALFGWGAFTLSGRITGKIVFFLISVFGLAYILPIGPIYDPALYLPYELIIVFALVSAFAFFYVWSKLLHFCIAFLISILGFFSAKSREFCSLFWRSKKINGALILLCLLISPYSVYETIKVPAIKHVTLAYQNLPQELEGYTIAQITDTHTGLIFTKDWQEAVVQKIMLEKPNLIVHTGDIGDTKPQKIAESLAPLKELSAPDGVFYVFGNHENYHTLSYWQKFFRENDLKFLENETVYIHEYLAVSGAKAKFKPHQAKAFLSKVPAPCFHIYLHHHPAGFCEAAPFIDLQLSGHTHGGTVFFLAPLVQHFNAGFVSGTYKLDNAKLYVSNGTGIWSYTAFRLFVPSEITILHLTQKN